MKINKCFFIVFVTCFCNIFFCFCQNKKNVFGLCGDQFCEEPYALGETVQSYIPDRDGVLRFVAGMAVKIYVSDLEHELLGVEIGGQYGFAPRRMIKETKVLKKSRFPAISNFLVLKSVNMPPGTSSSDINQQTADLPHVNDMSSTMTSYDHSSPPTLDASSPFHSMNSETFSGLPDVPLPSPFIEQPVFHSPQHAFQSPSPNPSPVMPNNFINNFVSSSPHTDSIIPDNSATLGMSPFVNNFDSSYIPQGDLNSVQNNHIPPFSGGVYQESLVQQGQEGLNIAPSSSIGSNFVPELSNNVLQFGSSSTPSDSNFIMNSVTEDSDTHEKQVLSSQIPPVPQISKALPSMGMDSSDLHGDASSYASSLPKEIASHSTLSSSFGNDPTSSEVMKENIPPSSVDDRVNSQLSIAPSMDPEELKGMVEMMADLVHQNSYVPGMFGPEVISAYEKSYGTNAILSRTESPHANVDSTVTSTATISATAAENLNSDVTKTESQSTMHANMGNLDLANESNQGEKIDAPSEDEGDDDDEADVEGEDEDDEMAEDEGYDLDGLSVESTLPEDAHNRMERSAELDKPEDTASSIEKPESSTEKPASFDEENSSNGTTPQVSDELLKENVDALHQSQTSVKDDIVVIHNNTNDKDGINEQSGNEYKTGISNSEFSHSDDTLSNIMNSGDNFASSSSSLHEKDIRNFSENEASGLDAGSSKEVPLSSEADYAAFSTRSILQEDDSTKASTAVENQNSGQDGATSDSSTPESVGSYISLDISKTFLNFVSALRAFLEGVIAFIPEPFYSYLVDLNLSGISARAVVFTSVISFPCLLLFVSIWYLKESSNEKCITAKLTAAEHQLYLASTERDVLREDVASLKEQIAELENNLEEERNLNSTMQEELQDFQLTNQSVSEEQQENLLTIRTLKKEAEDYKKTISELRKSISEANKENKQTLKKLQNEEKTVSSLNRKVDQLREEVANLQSEKLTFISNEKLYTEKISQLEEGCNQLLEEAKIWNIRVNELREETASHLLVKQELEKDIDAKDTEIQAMKTAILSLEAFQSLKESGEADEKTLEEKLAALLDISSTQKKLEKAEEEIELLLEKLKSETNKVLEMEVELLEAKSETEKLKMSYNQALQDKTQAQSKLNFLTEYFKEKEVQLQKELGAQETVRQQKEMDASQAERRIHLLEEENSSYKFQIATLKHEVEETERNLKKQVAAQEESAHKNWVAARSAERKVEELKQEVAQFRQRITLLEREREVLNSTQSDIIKPVPQRISESLHDISQDSNISGEFGIPRRIPPPPGSLGDPLQHPLPMMHPLLPPHPPPPMMPPPPFLPPFDHMMPPPPHRRPQPWHLLPDKNPDLRNTPSDFDSSVSSRRHHTPPFYDRDAEKRSSSPVEESSRSRGSSPLPDFHNVPPPISTRHHDFMSPPMHPRYTGGPPPMHRRDMDYGPPPVRSGNKPAGRDNNSYRSEAQNVTRDNRDYQSRHSEADI